jgi:ubiquinone/menaquinone biosynthesis C-methylase UbiE
MADLNVLTNVAVPNAYDFSRIECVVDVAGGNGSQLAAILQANSHMRGMLVDLPYALDQARRQLAAAGVVDRCEFVGEDIFERVPTGGDAYLLRWVLHDYDSERNVQILRNCRAAMPLDGRLLVVELVVPNGEVPASWVSKFLDLQMLLNFGGQERTEAEFRELFAAAGFRLQRVLPTQSPMSILEGVPC